MRYQDAIQYVYSLQKFGIKLGLEGITRVLRVLGDPHRRLRCVHVAGTNGKGSTCAILEGIVRSAGYRPGLYTSPHLSDFTERIQICRRTIPRGQVAELVGDIKRICERKAMPSVTFFEFTTALAFRYFYENRADPVIVETGMGGTYDATNVIVPLVSVITTVSADHQRYLGNTLRAIAREKAGIIKEKRPVVTGVRHKGPGSIVRARCAALQAPLYRLGQEVRVLRHAYPRFSYQGLGWELRDLVCGLHGSHQQRNAGLALAAAELLGREGYVLQEQDARTGVADAAWPARFEIVRRNPTIVIDGAHNPEACRVLRATIAEQFGAPRLIMIIGIMCDKDISPMLNILTQGAYATIVCRPEMERSATRDIFERYITFSNKRRVFWLDTSSAALNRALSLARPGDVVCAAGSLFLAGEIRELLIGRHRGASGRLGM